jgi:hypothetical protein
MNPRHPETVLNGYVESFSSAIGEWLSRDHRLVFHGDLLDGRLIDVQV